MWEVRTWLIGWAGPAPAKRRELFLAGVCNDATIIRVFIAPMYAEATEIQE